MQLLALAGRLLLRALQTLLHEGLHRRSLVHCVALAACHVVSTNSAYHGAAVAWASASCTIASDTIDLLKTVETLLFEDEELLGGVGSGSRLAVERRLHLLDAVDVMLRVMDGSMLLLTLIEQLHHLFVLGTET